MNEKLETNNKNESLDGDDDVLLFNQATFTVGRFKELVAREFSKILEIPVEKKVKKKAILGGIRLLQCQCLRCQFLRG